MKLIPKANELISNMRLLFQVNNLNKGYLNEEPLRSELFSSEQMARFAKTLATTHKLNSRPSKDHLLKRLAENELILHEVRKLLTDSIKRKYQITPAGEWLIDNFYLIEEHIRSAKIHFPKKYSEDLPQIVTSTSSGLTRIYDIGLQIISHCDGRIDMENLSSFIKSYQTVSNLKLGELWAIPIMLRLGLIENLRRVSSRIAIDRIDGNLADYWAAQMIETVEKDPKSLILVIADMARSNPPMVSAFVSELTRQLRGKGPDLALALNWIEQQLSEGGMSSAELVNAEIQKQAADQLSMSNSIGSLRLLGSTDWRNFVEAHSTVEQTLREDTNGIYGLMDFSTRDRYRHVVEDISKNSRISEYEVARIAINLMKDNASKEGGDERKSHVGYYLIDDGITETKRIAKMHESGVAKLRRTLKKHAFKIYIAFIFILTAIITSGLLYRVYVDTKDIWRIVVIGLLSAVCTSQLAISVVNFFSTLLVKPNLLPRMDFSKEIPPEYRTLVVVPMMLTSNESIETVVETLEVHFLANRRDNLYFGLLTDFVDAKNEHMPEDEALLTLVRYHIERLNEKYNRTDLFFLFHRPRYWNPKENVWMGYERKRGKLGELNSLLRGGAKDRFSVIIGDQSVLPDIKYVITLDADTQLPLGTACKLIGAMVHPLNKPLYNEKKKRITKGYGILQPRVTVSLPEISSSLYACIHGNEPGIDPYTRASSDVYQDLFGEGSFIGKGIYDVDTFKKVLDNRFAENGILSHDLLEGCYVRSGLLSDVQLFERYPDTYQLDMKRRVRWVRGDWQILFWLFPIVPGFDKHWYRNPISALSTWKIFDNIRRSLVPISLTVLIILGWIALPPCLFWTTAVSAIIIFPIVVTTIWDLIKKPQDVIWTHHIKNSFRSIGDIFVRTSFFLISLPYEAYLNLLAIVRTLWRMFITRKKLLEWNPSSIEEKLDRNSLGAYYLSMFVEPLLAIVIFFYLLFYEPLKLYIVAPILFLWAVAPELTWQISRARVRQALVLNETQNAFLRKVGRKTWGFFEQFVVEGDNWLPPDNFQEQPVAIIAHRTSPTNIGLSLLANIAACDFGYISTNRLIERSKKTISTMEKMERYKGHFYNWYDTETLAPLFPKYISTVDSGNLVAHLLVMRQGMLAVLHKKILPENLFVGILDTLTVLISVLEEKEAKRLQKFKAAVQSMCKTDLNALGKVKANLSILLEEYVPLLEDVVNDKEHEAYQWKNKLSTQLVEINEELDIFTPWLLMSVIPSKFRNLLSEAKNFTLAELIEEAKKIDEKIKTQGAGVSSGESTWLQELQTSLAHTMKLANQRLSEVEEVAKRCNDLAEVEWDFLYDKSSNLLTIGYNLQSHHIDASFYDLLASESRLCTFIGIAQGKLPEENWFSLGRLLTNLKGEPILLSWSGSMFEYLMPLLVMPTYDNTLLDQTCKAAVDWQIDYGKHAGRPWGISESGFNMINASSSYQYRAFGAPGLGLKRGLEEDAVIAPYASALALMIEPERACKNMEVLEEEGFEGQYGFYEAIDYTTSRLQRGQTNAIVYSFMAHHQGMSFLSLAYLLLDKPMQKLFEAEPQFKAALLLLQERVPRASSFFAHTTDIADVNYIATDSETRVIKTPNTPIPEVQLLSNGRYNVMVTNSGAGYSNWKDIAVTRWREDTTCDNWGMFCYIRDLDNGLYWSSTYQPSLKKGDKYEAVFSQGRVDFRTINNDIEAHTEIVVSPEDDIEMRRVTITNHSQRQRLIEITSYAEVVIAPLISDIMQASFSNLFVETEILKEKNSIICTRRPRYSEEHAPWLFHLMMVQGKEAEAISYETDRLEFIGRGNSTVNPKVMTTAGSLTGKQGAVLDPIVAIRYKITLEPEESVTFDAVMGIAETKDNCLNLIDKYRDRHHKDRVFELAWTHSQVVLRQINATEVDAQLYSSLASSIIFSNALFRPEPIVLINNRRGQSGLWGYSISGDLPIVLLRIEKQANMQMAKQLIQAHSYWRLKGLMVDLVIWNEEHSGYRQVFQNDIETLIPPEVRDKRGGIFVRASDQISNEDRILFQTVARVNISDNGGTLADHVKRKPIAKTVIPVIKATHKSKASGNSMKLPEGLLFYNGYGGFTADGSEYVIATDDKTKTPAPWVNVLVNANFGSVLSESGSAYTWTENAHELRLTPWNNDPISDSSGEAFYLRDEESGHFWSVTSLPAGAKTTYITRHGFGYSIFECIEDGIHSEMTEYVDVSAAVKFITIKVSNRSGKHRKLSATGYVEWVLGNNRMKTGMYVFTEINSDTGAIFAKNTYDNEFAGRIAFFDVDSVKRTYTGDRAEFIGRNGTIRKPDAMYRVKLSGKVGLALDPCAALQVPFELEDGATHEIVFRLGVGRDLNDTCEIVKQFKGAEMAQNALERVKNKWQSILNVVKVETPDKTINTIINGWLTYQTLSSRIWGRSGYYQSGGAFGFRDQLQDVLSVLHIVPEVAREQILLCASRQFKEGDVQHWWHPPTGKGVRTRCSDDYLWLPFVTSAYITSTGETAILDEKVPFLEGRLLNADEQSYYDSPIQSGITETVYNHCVQAIKHGLKYGEHGLPLMGAGDWNDGFDKVGKDGKGESIWLAFFLYDILIKFSELALLHNDLIFNEECIKEAQQLKENIDKHTWDGQWYKRAWFDNGTPLGSSVNDECKIDSIAQSWSVLSGGGDENKMKTALESAYTNLVKKNIGVIQLLEPPFNKSTLDPGYIKGYVPGVRENGGQYTHAAVWLVMAFAKLGNTERVWELLEIINPINHSNTSERINIYKVEPYVLAADVYISKLHEGRGGWTWYTGSAGWLYQLIVESFLGVQKKGEKLQIVPCVPKEWTSFKIEYRYKDSVYHITVIRDMNSKEITTLVNGTKQADNMIQLSGDKAEHNVQILLP